MPKRLHVISSTRYAITHKIAVLIYFLPEARYLACIIGSSSRKIQNTDQRPLIFFENPQYNLYSMILCNVMLRTGNILRVSGENVCKSRETDCNRLM